MGAPKGTEVQSQDKQPCFLVFHNGGKPFAVPVDYISDVIGLSSQDLEARRPDQAPGVTGVAKTRLGMVTIVNVASYFQKQDFEVAGS